MSTYRHRKAWVQERLETLARIFGVDAAEFAVIEQPPARDAPHVILCKAPDVLPCWSDEQVARR